MLSLRRDRSATSCSGAHASLPEKGRIGVSREPSHIAGVVADRQRFVCAPRLHPPLPSCGLTTPEEGSKFKMDSQHVPESTESTDFQASVRAGISREMVRLCKEKFGRGLTKARTEFAGPDIVVCTLEDTLHASRETAGGDGRAPAPSRHAAVFPACDEERIHRDHQKNPSGARSAPSTAASTRTPASRWRPFHLCQPLLRTQQTSLGPTPGTDPNGAVRREALTGLCYVVDSAGSRRMLRAGAHGKPDSRAPAHGRGGGLKSLAERSPFVTAAS